MKGTEYPCRCSPASLAMGLLCCLLFSTASVHAVQSPPPLPESRQIQLDSPQQDVSLQLRGAAAPGGMLRGFVTPGWSVFLDDQPRPTDAEGRFLLGFGRDQFGPVRLSVRNEAGQTREWTLDLGSREYEIQRIEGIPQKMMQPDAATLERIRIENLRVTAARAQHLDRSNWAERFIWPLEGVITGVYGSQRFYNGEPRRPHFGVDVAAPTGTPIVAPAGGVVTLAEPDLFFSGGTLILDHGMGLSSSFLHLSRLLVAVGTEVEQGQVIAEVGATGRVTGAHLDWRMNLDGVRIDPQLLMAGE